MTIRSLRDVVPQCDTMIQVAGVTDNTPNEVYWGKACDMPDKILDAELDYFYPCVSIDNRPYIVAITFDKAVLV